MVALTRQHLDWVQALQRVHFSSVPASVADDLVDAGIEGLVQAAQRYVDNGRATFKSYAIWRVRGAMLDHLRRPVPQLVEDWAPIEAQLGGSEPIHHWEQAQTLETAIGGLTEGQQQVIRLSLLGYRQCDMAQMLGVGQPAIHRRLKAAHTQLRLLLDRAALVA